MLISHSHRFVFVHIPKTAGTSLTQMLAPYCAEAPGTRPRRIARKLGLRQDPTRAFFRSHDTALHVLRAFGPETFASYRVFSVIRNPFDHAVSHYTYLREFPKARVTRHFAGMAFSDYLDFRLHPGAFSRLPPFARITDQTSFLDDGKGRIVVPRLLRFETLAEDVAALMAELGLPDLSLPHARPTKGRAGTLAEFYATPGTEERILRLYERDFANFGYPHDWRAGLPARA